MTPTDYSGFVSEEQLSPSLWRLHDVLSPIHWELQAAPASKVKLFRYPLHSLLL